MQRSRQPRGRMQRLDSSQRPAWDDTLHDLSHMRLTPAEQLQRRAQRVSKHYLLARRTQNGSCLSGDGSQSQASACDVHPYAPDGPSSSASRSSASRQDSQMAAAFVPTPAAGADDGGGVSSATSSTCSSPRADHDQQLPGSPTHNLRYGYASNAQQSPGDDPESSEVHALQQQVLDLSRQLAATTWQLQRTQQQLEQLQQVQAEQQGRVEASAAACGAPNQPQPGIAAAGAEIAGGGSSSSSSSMAGAADPMQQRMDLLMPLQPGQDVRRAAVSDQQRPGMPGSDQQLQQQGAAALGASPPAAVPAAPDALKLPRFAEVRRQAVGLGLGSTAAAAAAPSWSSAAGRGQEPDALTELLEDMKAGPWEQLLHPQQQQQQQEGVTAAHVSTSLLAAARPGGQDAAAGAWGVAAGRPKGVAGWVCSDVPPAAAPGSGWRPGDDVREPVGDQDAALQSNWQQLEGVLPGPSDVDRGFVAGVVRAAVGQVQALAAGYSSGPGKLAWAGGKVHPGQLAGSMSFKQHVEGGEVVAGGQASLAGRLGAASVLLGSV